MKKTYKVKNNQTLKFNDFKTDKEYTDNKKDLLTENFNNKIDIKHPSTWEYGKPKKLAESKVFSYLSEDVSPIKENKKANKFLNDLHFIEDRKKVKKIKKSEEPTENHSIVGLNTKKETKEVVVPYYLVQLKDTMEYLSFDINGEEILTKDKANAEMFISKDTAKDAIERFVFNSVDLDWGDYLSNEDSFDSVEDFIAESISDFIISPVHEKQLREGLNHSIAEITTLKEKSIMSKLQDVAFYIVSIYNNPKKIMYVGKEFDEDEDFIAVDYKEDAEAFESKDEADEAIDNLIYQVLNTIEFDSEDIMAEHNKYEELSSDYVIEAVFVNPQTLYYKPLKEAKKKFGIRRIKN